MKGIGLKDEEQKKKLKEIKEKNHKIKEDEEQKKKLKEIKKKNNKIKEKLKLKQDEILKMSDSDLTEKLGKILI